LLMGCAVAQVVLTGRDSWRVMPHGLGYYLTGHSLF